MIYDYSFLKSHASFRRRLFGSAVAVEAALSSYFQSGSMAADEICLEQRADGDLFFAHGVYFKGGQSVQPLEASLKTKLPEDFVQFYEQFGETAIITRSEPILIYPLKQMIDDFEDDPDIDIEEGRFFRFARYQDPLYLGLRRDDQTDDWQVVICTYGYPDKIYPRDGNVPYLTVLEE